MTEPKGAKARGLRFVAGMRRFEGEAFGVLVEGGILGGEGFGEPVPYRGPGGVRLGLGLGVRLGRGLGLCGGRVGGGGGHGCCSSLCFGGEWKVGLFCGVLLLPFRVGE